MLRRLLPRRPLSGPLRRLCGGPDPALVSKLRALPAAERAALFEAVAAGAEGAAAAPPAAPSSAQLRRLFVATAIPMVGFGFVDNSVMIASGEFLEVQLGALFAVSTLAAAGLGNLVSDVVGLGAGGVIEAGAAKVGVEVPALTAAQAASRGAAVARHSASIFGISLGCLLGMFPLLFYDEDTARLRTIFARYDADGNGSLDRDELRSAFADAKTFPSDADLDGLLRRYDVDGDGCIGYDEFEKMVKDVEDKCRCDARLDARSVMAQVATAERADDGGP